MKRANDIMSTEDALSRFRGPRRLVFLAAKVLEYCVRYFGRPRYLIAYLSGASRRGYKEEVRFMSDEAFRDAAINRSSIRLGDGEFGLVMSRKGIHFQEADPRLIEKLRILIESYRSDSPFMLGVNPQIAMGNRVLAPHGLKYLFMPQKIGFRFHADKDMEYFNASYFYIDRHARAFLKSISARRHVVVVTKRETVDDLRRHERDLLPDSLSVSYVVSPATNAFADYDRLLQKTRDLCKGEPCTVLVGCGPAGKILVHELSLSGTLAHDIGHGLTFAVDGQNHEDVIKWSELKKHHRTVK